MGSKKDERVDKFIEKKSAWQDSLKLLRKILLSSELQEDVKWGMPAYILQGKNVVSMVAFKAYAGLWFHNGVYLKDKKKVLNGKEGTRGLRHWEFSSLEEVKTNQKLVKEYVEEAVQNQKAGKEIKPIKKGTLRQAQGT